MTIALELDICGHCLGALAVHGPVYLLAQLFWYLHWCLALVRAIFVGILSLYCSSFRRGYCNKSAESGLQSDKTQKEKQTNLLATNFLHCMFNKICISTFLHLQQHCVRTVHVDCNVNEEDVDIVP